MSKLFAVPYGPFPLTIAGSAAGHLFVDSLQRLTYLPASGAAQSWDVAAPLNLNTGVLALTALTPPLECAGTEYYSLSGAFAQGRGLLFTSPDGSGNGIPWSVAAAAPASAAAAVGASAVAAPMDHPLPLTLPLKDQFVLQGSITGIITVSPDMKLTLMDLSGNALSGADVSQALNVNTGVLSKVLLSPPYPAPTGSGVAMDAAWNTEGTGGGNLYVDSGFPGKDPEPEQIIIQKPGG